MRVLAIPGSLRSESLNARLLRHVAEQAPRDIEIELWEDLRSLLTTTRTSTSSPRPRRSPISAMRSTARTRS